MKTTHKITLKENDEYSHRFGEEIVYEVLCGYWELKSWEPRLILREVLNDNGRIQPKVEVKLFYYAKREFLDDAEHSTKSTLLSRVFGVSPGDIFKYATTSYMKATDEEIGQITSVKYERGSI